MAILPILTFPAPALRRKALPVREFGARLEKIVQDMLDTMYDAPGVGLAANQVGILERIVVIDVDYDIEGDDERGRAYVNRNPRALVNAEILEKSGEILFREGCLSVPGVTEQVRRFEKVRARFQGVGGSEQVLDAQGFLAVAIQHELDHLEGKLFIDRLSEVKKGMIKRRLLKQRPEKFERSRFHVEL